MRRDVSDALHADEVTGKTFQNQRKVTNEEVPADVFRRPDENRPGIEVALEHSKTFLDAPKLAQVREDLLRGGILVGGGDDVETRLLFTLFVERGVHLVFAFLPFLALQKLS